MTSTYPTQNSLNSTPKIRWLITILLLGVTVIFFTTLFPFDFLLKTTPTIPDFLEALDKNLLNPFTLNDIPRNIILFIPIGFALTGLLIKLNFAKWATLIIIAPASLMLSISLEILQMDSLFRYPTLGDILANTWGAVLGFLLFIIWGEKLYSIWSQLLSWFDKKVSFGWLLLSYLCFVAVLLASSVTIREQTKLSNWNSNFPLILGNEATENRPWQGMLTHVYLADEAIDDTQIAALLDGNSASIVLTDSLVANYDFSTNTADSFPPLERKGSAPFAKETTGALFTENQWFFSRFGGPEITNVLKDSSQFTLGLIAAPAHLEQDGPANIFSISRQTYDRNLTVAQSGSDLNLRIRTLYSDRNGRHPEFIFSDVFTDTSLHHIIITYTGTTINLYIDEPESVYTVALVPAISLFGLIFPATIEQIQIGRHNIPILHLLYNALFLVPTAGVLVYQLRKSTLQPIWIGIVIIVATPLVSVLWEVALTLLISGYRLQIEYTLMNMPIFLMTTLYFYWLTRPIDAQVIEQIS